MKKIALTTLIILAVLGLSNAQSTTWNTLGNSFPLMNPEVYFIGSTTDYPLFFRTNNVDRMYISSTGNVGVGTIVPQLLEKVEELTRYVIDLHQIDELKNGKE